MKILTPFILLFSCIMFVSASCSDKTQNPTSSSDEIPSTSAPATTSFNADSAYNYVAAQTKFGPRVPGSEAHALCAEYLAAKLREAGMEVSFQDVVKTDPNGVARKVKNIIGKFRPDADINVLLAAHYDSRPRADQDADSANHDKPLDGANDGASGVGVILELMRHRDELPENVGIEVAFFDQEDNGDYDGDDALWCIGSQVWADEVLKRSRRPMFGILLDMVGGRDAVFNPEYFSTAYAGPYVDMVWGEAGRLGYGNRFPYQSGGALNDDHVYVMHAGVPCIDIVECNNPDTGSFNPTWHTLNDNLDNIDRNTLKVVGDVVLSTLKNLK